MKSIRVLLSLMMVVAVLFASTFCAFSIGFEAEKAYESVFVVYSGNSMGSGFAIGENCIITNAHVIADPDSITVVTYGGTEHKALALGINEQEDIAVLAVSDATFPYLQVADLSQMKTGDDIYAIGAPKGMPYTLTKGGISAKERTVRNQSYIQIDAPINEGNSGGPLLNDDGQVLGVNTMKLTDSEGIGLAIPITRVCEYLRALGIQLDDNGNTSSRVQLPEPQPPAEENLPPNQQDNTTEQEEPQQDPAILYGAILIAVASLAANAVLTVLLINEKKKSATLQAAAQYDPSERTDFEIDIWE